MSARDGRTARWGLACAASLAIHGGTLLALDRTRVFTGADRPPPYRVALARLPLPQWEANRRVPPPEARTREPGQIVSLPPGDPWRSTRPPPASVRRLATRDRTVEKETVAADERTAANAAPGDGDAAAPPREAVAAAPQPSTPLALAAAPVEPPSAPDVPPPAPIAAAEDGEAGHGAGPATSEPPAPGASPRAAAGGSVDAPGVERGAETRLNTRRFAPADYWIEVRGRIQAEWERRALAVTKAADPNEDTYFYKKRSVVVRIALDPAGAVRDAAVVESSRLEFYDAVAIAVVREQQPYPPPPPTAIGGDGLAKVKIRFEWSPSVLRKALR